MATTDAGEVREENKHIGSRAQGKEFLCSAAANMSGHPVQTSETRKLRMRCKIAGLTAQRPERSEECRHVLERFDCAE